ncbi:MAG: hypothetical protein QNJ98_05480 [Planctomycetota bacterium]|nr:hypothetical protein [Planctomycetota bacterium]
MRLALSLLTSSLLVFGALAFTAEPADAKGFSMKRLKKSAKRISRSTRRSVKRYTQPTSSRRMTTRSVTRNRGIKPAPLDTRRRFYNRQFPTGRHGYLHRPKNGLPAFGAPTATGRTPTMAERFYYRNQITRNGAPMTGGRYASQARQARQAQQARQARQYQQYRMPAWNQRKR